VKISSTTSSAVIVAMKFFFSWHGLPEIIPSDNGPQFTSKEMADFTSFYGNKHITSSPYAKQFLKQSDDLNVALLNYQATPLPWCNRSPSELLMGRCIRTTLQQPTLS